MTYENVLKKLKDREAFSFSRWGDGEWNAVLGVTGANCDGHQYFPDMGKRLREIIQRKPGYTLGMQPHSMSERYKNFDRLKEFLKTVDIQWANADIFHHASINGEIGKLIEAVKERYLIIVGPAHLSKIFDCVHIITPPINCWLNYEEIRQQIDFHIDGVNNAVVLFSASMMSNVLIDDFHDRHHTLIDTGSVFDPYCNVFSRTYHFNLKI